MNPHAIERSPAADSELGYPTLTAHGDARRRFLKLCALSTAAAALGLELTGCPSDSGGGGGVGETDYVPWDGMERMGGLVAMPVGQPVAVVVGGGPIPVTFKDGVKKEIVVAGVLTLMDGTDPKADVTAKAKSHAKIIRAAAAKLPSTVFTDAKAMEAFEKDVRDQLNNTLGGGYFDELSAAEAEHKKPSTVGQSNLSESASAPAPSLAAERSSLVAEPATATPALDRSPKAKILWTPCRRAGCTTCKS